jgi:hypothetical protein
MIERRHHERRVFGETISYRTSGHKAGLPEDRMKKGLCVDISSGGIGLMTDREFQKGEVMELLLPIGVEDTIVPVFAELRWSTLAEGGTRVGLRFLR